MRGERLSNCLFRLVCLGFSAALLLLTLFSQIQLVRTESRIGELEKALDKAENESVLLRLQSCEALNLAELERRALEMGMRRPEPGQIIHLNDNDIK
jgi:hypothetical protein